MSLYEDTVLVTGASHSHPSPVVTPSVARVREDTVKRHVGALFIVLVERDQSYVNNYVSFNYCSANH